MRQKRYKYKIGIRYRYKIAIRYRYKTGIRYRYKIGIRYRYKIGIRYRYKIGIRYFSYWALISDNSQIFSKVYSGGSLLYRNPDWK